MENSTLKTIGNFKTKRTLIVGTNFTGKTTLVKKYISEELESKRNRVLIVVPDQLEFNSIEWIKPEFPQTLEFNGARKIIYKQGIISILKENFKNGLLILEDSGAYLSKKERIEIIGLLIRGRQNLIDIIATGHGFAELSPVFFKFCTHIALFKTIDNIRCRKDQIPNYEAIKEAQQRINNNAIEYPHYYETLDLLSNQKTNHHEPNQINFK